jgi:hypothetical protein
MFTLKLALLTCCFYLAGTAAIQLVVFLIARLRGSFIIYATKSGWVGLFGILWLVSFLASWRVLKAFTGNRLPR